MMVAYGDAIRRRDFSVSGSRENVISILASTFRNLAKSRNGRRSSTWRCLGIFTAEHDLILKSNIVLY